MINKYNKILVTGGAGMIGSALIHQLNKLQINNIDVCDHLGNTNKWLNLRTLKFGSYIELEELKKFFLNKQKLIQYDYIFHFGGTSNEDEEDMTYLINNNYKFTCDFYNRFIQRQSRTKFIYISSKDTYGDYFIPFSDNDNINELILNTKIGYSKHLIDLEMQHLNLFNQGVLSLKLSNVFGCNEYHKKSCSIIKKFYDQIINNGKVNIYKSYNKKYKNGQQNYDFIYIKDAISMILFLVNKNAQGIYNISSGTTYSLNDISKILFNKLNKEQKINYIDIPENKKNNYQYYSCLDNQKIYQLGYNKNIFNIEEAIQDYLIYLKDNKRLGMIKNRIS